MVKSKTENKVHSLKINSLIDITPIVTNILATRELTILHNNNYDFNVRFSKTSIKNRYKHLSLDEALRIFIKDIIYDVYVQLVNHQMISLYLENNNIDVSVILGNLERLYEIYYCNTNSNTFMLKFKTL